MKLPYRNDIVSLVLGINLSDEKYDEEKFKIISKHILEKYHKAFEELAK